MEKFSNNSLLTINEEESIKEVKSKSNKNLIIENDRNKDNNIIEPNNNSQEINNNKIK